MESQSPVFMLSVNPFDRVRSHTPSEVNSRIDRTAEDCVTRYASMGLDEILHRISELDQEWDVDRALMLNFAVAGGLALALSLRVNRRFSYLLGAQLMFMGYHAVKGWCPPLAVLRRLGFRTQHEIYAEKKALESLLSRQVETTPRVPSISGAGIRTA